MKKNLLVLFSAISLAGTMIISTSCKKDDVAPASTTTTGYTFSVAGTGGNGTVYSNLSQDASAGTTGSFYGFESKSSYITTNAKDNASFQFTTEGGKYYIQNTITSTNASLNGVSLTKGATFETSSAVYADANAATVFNTTNSKSKLEVTDGSVVTFTTKSGQKGILKATLTDDGGATKYKKLTFEFKLVTEQIIVK